MTSSELALVLVSSALWFACIMSLYATGSSAFDYMCGEWLVPDLPTRARTLRWDPAEIVRRLRLWVLVTFATALLVGIGFRMLPLAAGGTLILLMLPRHYVDAAISANRRQLRADLATAAQMLANYCRAGESLPRALKALSQELDGPLASDLGRISFEFSHGRPLAEAIREAQERLALDEFSLFASAVLVSLRHGGNLTETLEAIAKSLREGQRLERKLDADTASGRKVIRILAAFPALFLGGFMLLEPEGTGRLFTTLPGQLVIVLIGFIVYRSVRWANRIMAVTA